MNIQKVELKVGNMRKAQKFVIYPNGTSDTKIILQSDKSIAFLGKSTDKFYADKFYVNTKGSTFPHMIGAVEIPLDEATKEEIRRKYNARQNGENGVIGIFGRSST